MTKKLTELKARYDEVLGLRTRMIVDPIFEGWTMFEQELVNDLVEAELRRLEIELLPEEPKRYDETIAELSKPILKELDRKPKPRVKRA